MTFDEVMKKYNGEWSNGRAVIQAQGGYYWCIAVGSAENYELTTDGKRYVTEYDTASPAPEPKVKRGRKLSAVLKSVDE